MLVAFSNAVKVESVPLNSDQFSAPPGWTPPQGWQPDPSWPPVPPGWQLWVPDAPRRKTGLIIGALGFVRESGEWKWCEF